MDINVIGYLITGVCGIVGGYVATGGTMKRSIDMLTVKVDILIKDKEGQKDYDKRISLLERSDKETRARIIELERMKGEYRQCDKE